MFCIYHSEELALVFNVELGRSFVKYYFSQIAYFRVTYLRKDQGNSKTVINSNFLIRSKSFLPPTDCARSSIIMQPARWHSIIFKIQDSPYTLS